MPDCLRTAFEAAVKHGRIRCMQNKQVTSQPLHPAGALMLGDAFNMRHPLTGGGMTVAFSDTSLLCDMLSPLPDFSNKAATSGETGVGLRAVGMGIGVGMLVAAWPFGACFCRTCCLHHPQCQPPPYTPCAPLPLPLHPQTPPPPSTCAASP